MTRRKHYPSTRPGWFAYYAARFAKTECPQACHLAMWYLLLSLAKSDGVL